MREARTIPAPRAERRCFLAAPSVRVDSGGDAVSSPARSSHTMRALSSSSASTPPASPREPEIEVLARLVRGGLWCLRRALWIAGAVAIGHGLMGCWDSSTLSAPPIVWLCVGVPLVCRVDWLFGRGRWWALATGVLSWFGAALLPADHQERIARAGTNPMGL